VTSREKAQIEYSSLTWSVVEGRALLRARAECLATIALDGAADEAGFGEVAGSAESPEKSCCLLALLGGGMSAALVHSLPSGTSHDFDRHLRRDTVVVDAVPPSLFHGVVSAACAA